MEHPLVQFEHRDEIALVTLDHPQKRNVLSRAMLSALAQSLEGVREQRSIKCVILAANGPVFSAGHDLAELAAASDAERQSLFALCTEVMLAIRRLDQPVIAQVQGLATAAGCQLAATCDLVIAAEQAGFATPGIKIGLFCSTPAVPLSRAVPIKKAMEMLLTAEVVPAAEAERLGLVNRVVPADRLAETTWTLARQIAASSPATVRLGKRAFYEQVGLSVEDAYRQTERAMIENSRLPDALEGMNAFLERRPPRWNQS